MTAPAMINACVRFPNQLADCDLRIMLSRPKALDEIPINDLLILIDNQPTNIQLLPDGSTRKSCLIEVDGTTYGVVATATSFEVAVQITSYWGD